MVRKTRGLRCLVSGQCMGSDSVVSAGRISQKNTE